MTVPPVATTSTEPLHPVVREDVDDIVSRAASALHQLEDATVLVAGGAGFLPSFLVDALARANDTLLDRPCRVLVLDSFLTGTASRLAHLYGRDDVRLLEQDLTTRCDPGEHVDHVVHAASVASPTWYRRHPLETIDVNVTGTRRLLDLAVEHRVRGFLYLSSSEIYGDPPPDQVPTTEDYRGNVSCSGPRACYDESKRLAETLCTTYHRHHGVPVRIARPFNVYGPRLRLDDGRIVPDLLADALAGRPVTLFSDGAATRSFCYVTDAVTALLHLLVSGPAGEAYNVGNDEEVTIRRVAETVDALRPRPAGVRRRHHDDPDYLTDNPDRRCPDLRKVTAAIPWAPEVDLATGLERTYRAYASAVR